MPLTLTSPELLLSRSLMTFTQLNPNVNFQPFDTIRICLLQYSFLTWFLGRSHPLVLFSYNTGLSSVFWAGASSSPQPPMLVCPRAPSWVLFSINLHSLMISSIFMALNNICLLMIPSFKTPAQIPSQILEFLIQLPTQYSP